MMLMMMMIFPRLVLRPHLLTDIKQTDQTQGQVEKLARDWDTLILVAAYVPQSLMVLIGN